MNARRALLVLPVVLTALAAPVLAAPKPAPPQIVDAKGDSAGGHAPFDILSVAFTTTGPGSGKAYVPKKLVVTMTLAGEPRKEGMFSYVVNVDLDSCGIMQIKYSPGNVIGTVIGDTYTKVGSCAAAFWFPAMVKGSVVTFEYALKSLGVDRGTVFSDFTAGVNVVEPALGEFGTTNGPAAGVLDSASGDGTWIVP